MTPVDVPGTNLVLGAPADWCEEKDGKCDELHVIHKGNSFTSFWKPTDQELETLKSGGYIFLTVLASGHPPIAIGTATATK